MQETLVGYTGREYFRGTTYFALPPREKLEAKSDKSHLPNQKEDRMNWISGFLLQPMVLVGLGGAIGSVARYGVGLLLLQVSLAMQMPLATTIVNISGSFALGCLAGSSSDRSQPFYLFLAVGCCGGFTTFSTFSLEMVEHLQQGRLGVALLECMANVALGAGALYVGLALTK
ncbi:MAG: fluoride efflux transporter CrcB [Pirellula staleyi]